MPNPQIKAGILRQHGIDSSIISELASRDAVLWLGEGVGAQAVDAPLIASLASLPWRLVLCEEYSRDLVLAIDARKDDPDLVPFRGYVDIIASNPDDVPLPTRTLPIYMLNGRGDFSGTHEAAQIPKQAALRRRLNMLKRLVDAAPRLLVFVSSGTQSSVESICELWNEGFRSRLVFVSNNQTEIEALDKEFCSRFEISAVALCVLSPTDFAAGISDATRRTFEPTRFVVRVRDEQESPVSLDVTPCEKPDRPILDRYDLILEKDLIPLLPEDLSDNDLNGFFERSSQSWRPYAAGLPLDRDPQAVRRVLRTLEEVHHRGVEKNSLFVIESEPGAGGTTLLRSLAFKAAENGFPAFVAKQVDFEPDALELTGFLFEMHQRRIHEHESHLSLSDKARATEDIETPVLLGFDAQHWRGHEEGLITFFKRFEREGRSVVVLAVMDPDCSAPISGAGLKSLDSRLTHELCREDAIALGEHLNRFLKPRGRDRSPQEWGAFHEKHAPRIGDFGATAATFWIALEFWLKRQLPLGESIQGWLYRQFETATLPDDVRLVLFEIAALTLERCALPEGLIPTPSNRAVPYSIALDEVRRQVPALGLTRLTSESNRQWILGHVLLARYLLVSAFRDRPLLERLGLSDVTSPAALRLELLRRIATHPDISLKRFLPLAVEFAVSVLKLDRDGNREFFTEWERVLSILEQIPDRVWETSRAFNHHVAVSRRRIASDKEFFPLSNAERRTQLDAAREHLEFALERIDAQDDDDSDLNLLNTLARTYQDLAQLELEDGAEPTTVAALRQKATDCIRRAEARSATNSYVLETLARDLLQHADHCAKEAPTDAARYACEALGHLRRALSLESAVGRQARLQDMLWRCFKLFEGAEIHSAVEGMRRRKDPIGIAASAWMTLTEGAERGSPIIIDQIPSQRIDAALKILDEISTGARSWIDLRMKYDLVAVRTPHGFEQQLQLLDELEGAGSRRDLQTKVEYAILLYQRGRIAEGSELFRAIRNELKSAEVFVDVPERMRVLLNPHNGKPELCSAVVVSSGGGTRSFAAVQNLQNEKIPFIPREFRKDKMGIRERFRCHITFGPNGPFIRPTT